MTDCCKNCCNSMACTIVDCKFVLHSSDTCCLQHRMEPGWLSRYSDWLGLDIPGPESRRVTDTFSRMSRPAVGHTQPPVQWAPNVLSPAVKRRGREVSFLTPSNPEVKNERSCIPPPPVCLNGVHKDATRHLYDVATLDSNRTRAFLVYLGLSLGGVGV
jgi:hypothetical protein